MAPGFGFRQPDGTYAGSDIDYCKVIAAAVLGDATKVHYKPLAAVQRFHALQERDRRAHPKHHLDRQP